jgi:molybdate transport system substrate-binding protein
MTNSIKVLAAGSLRRAWAPLCEAFQDKTGGKVVTEFGPAGLLRERIEQGEKVDIFASANTAHPLALQQHGKALEVDVFCGNSLCVTARKGPELEKLNWLNVLLDSRFRLATSTPQSDPSGDYTWQMFELIERRHPGAGEALRNKALRLVGGAKSAKVPEGKLAAEWLICSGQADVFIGYTSYATLLRENDALEVFNVPADYNVRARYALATCTEKGKPLAEFILSETGQHILQNAGFCGKHSVMQE